MSEGVQGGHNSNADEAKDSVGAQARGGDEADEDQFSCVSEKVHIQCNKEMVLYLLYIGLRAGIDDNESLFCLDREPWSLLPKFTVHPKSIDYEKEIVQRGELFRMTPVCRPRNWNKGQRIEWLERYPVVGAADIEFLKNEVMQLTDVWNKQVTEASSGGGGRGGHWRGAVPYLRMIMCLTEDNVKSLLLPVQPHLSRLSMKGQYLVVHKTRELTAC